MLFWLCSYLSMGRFTSAKVEGAIGLDKLNSAVEVMRYLRCAASSSAYERFICAEPLAECEWLLRTQCESRFSFIERK